MGETHSMMDVAPTVCAALGMPVPAGTRGSPIPPVVANLAGVERIAALAPDARLQRLIGHLKPLGYGVIVLADHGQHDIVDDPTTNLKGGHGSGSDQDCQVPCTWL